MLKFQSFFKQKAECTVDGCETVFGNNGEAHALNRRVRKHYEKEHAEADMAGRYYILYFYIYFLFLLFQRPGTNIITSLVTLLYILYSERKRPKKYIIFLKIKNVYFLHQAANWIYADGINILVSVRPRWK